MQVCEDKITKQTRHFVSSIVESKPNDQTFSMVTSKTKFAKDIYILMEPSILQN